MVEHQAFDAGLPRERGRVALLVDGDNLSVARAGQLLMKASRLGQVVIKRVYVDPHHLANWTHSSGFTLCAGRAGNGASDLRLAIDAVDLFHTGQLEAVVIASSDGGFAPLARFLVERGLIVLGLGEAKAPLDWQKSCTRFEILRSDELAPNSPPKPSPAPTAQINLASQSASEAPIEERVAYFVNEAGPGGLRLSALGSKMKDEGVLRTGLGAPTWQDWVVLHGDKFRLEGAGAGLHILLKPSS